MRFTSGLKTLDHLMEMPLINSALENGINRYSKLRDRSLCFNILSGLTEFSFKIVKFAASPVLPLIKDPVDSIDNYLDEKLNLINKKCSNASQSIKLFHAKVTGIWITVKNSHLQLYSLLKKTFNKSESLFNQKSDSNNNLNENGEFDLNGLKDDDVDKEKKLIEYYIQSDEENEKDAYNEFFIDEANLYIEENAITGKFEETNLNSGKSSDKHPKFQKLFNKNMIVLPNWM